MMVTVLQVAFCIGMIGTFAAMLVALLSGAMHRSAHPQGERPQLRIIVEGWNHRPGDMYPQPPPHIALIVGGMVYDNTWGLELMWDLDPEPTPYTPLFRRGLRIGIDARFITGVKLATRHALPRWSSW